MRCQWYIDEATGKGSGLCRGGEPPPLGPPGKGHALTLLIAAREELTQVNGSLTFPLCDGLTAL